MKKNTLSSKLKAPSFIILGIDPGYARMGLAIIDGVGNNQKLVHSECFETNTKTPHPERLLLIGNKVKNIIEKYKPNKIALETILFGKNHKTAIQVAEARGAILLEAAKSGIMIYEYNPNQIKLAITSYGKSDKKQIIQMLEHLIKMPDKKMLDDEYDAIAVALTCSALHLSTDRIH